MLEWRLEPGGDNGIAELARRDRRTGYGAKMASMAEWSLRPASRHSWM